MMIENFHFLRPEWLAAIIPAAVIFYLCWHRQLHGSSWHKIIDASLLRHLLHGEQTQRERWPLYALALTMLISILALAGPAWKKLPQPVAQTQDALLIVLDLSLSMRANDVTPSRIARAHLKLRDVLAAREEGLTALIVFAGDAHTVAPFTDDAKTIENMLPALQPEIMPKLGSRPDYALELGKQLMKDANLNQARVLLLADDIKDKQLGAMKDALGDQLELSIMSVGTAEGGPIPLPQGGFLKDSFEEIVVAQMSPNAFRSAATELGARYQNMQNDNSDIAYLLPSGIAALGDLKESEREFDVWQDEGSLLLLLLLPLALLAFRRGLIVPMVMVVLLPQTADAFEPAELWDNLWQTKDQQASKALERGDAEKASELFEQPDWKASAAYKAGNYQAASELFGDNAHYNRGNALAKSGKLDEAIEAYENALETNPEDADAQFNKELVEKLKQEQEQQQQNQQQKDQEQNNQDQNNQDQQQNESQQNDQQSDSEQQSQQNDSGQSDNENSEQNQENSEQTQNSEQQNPEENNAAENEHSKQEQQSEQEQQNEQQEQQTASAQQGELDPEKQQELEQWLRKVPDDPGGLLRNKFRYQYEQNRRKREHYDKDGQLY